MIKKLVKIFFKMTNLITNFNHIYICVCKCVCVCTPALLFA